VFLPPIARSQSYISLLGYAGLSIEAFLPVPQILSNQRAQSCKGFRLSVLISWLIGDAMKMGYFFFSGDAVPWAFRMCGILQCCCDCYLGVQYWMFGEGKARDGDNAVASNEFDGIDRRWMKADR
jgi:alpha 1,3-glucosidase